MKKLTGCALVVLLLTDLVGALAEQLTTVYLSDLDLSKSRKNPLFLQNGT
jgi:hypothetical protein